MRRLVFFSSVFLLFATNAIAQDPAKVGPTIYKCVLENERVRVCEIRFRPGDSIGLHSHPEHVVYVTQPGRLRITTDGVPTEMDFKTGQAVSLPAGAHSAVNVGNSELRGLVVELREPMGDPTQRALIQMERDWAQAMVRGDMSVIDRIVAPDWVMVDPGGQRTSRDVAMGDVRSGVMKFTSMTPSDLDVRVYGDTAVVSGRSTDRGTYKGQDISGEYRFTDVFVKRDGKWQAVSTHVTRVAPPM